MHAFIHSFNFLTKWVTVSFPKRNLLHSQSITCKSEIKIVADIKSNFPGNMNIFIIHDSCSVPLSHRPAETQSQTATPSFISWACQFLLSYPVSVVSSHPSVPLETTFLLYESDQRKLEKRTFPKSEEETVGWKKKQDEYGLKKEREKDLFGFSWLDCYWNGEVLVAWGLVNEAKKGGREEDWCES
jgi:hypothetical protein